MPTRRPERTIEGVTPGICAVCDRAPWVLVAVRHPVMRRYIAELLACEARQWRASELGPGEMLPAAIERFRPDLLVVDSSDFPACCLAAIEAFPSDRVVVVGPEPDPAYRDAAVAHGAAACITRDDVGDQLVSTMRSLLGCTHGATAPSAPGRERLGSIRSAG